VGLDVPIESKLHPPSWRHEWVERAGLSHYLAGTTARLVLVSAPAGSAKTTLVAQWRARAAEGRRFAWVSLDRGDDDPTRLWWYVVSALRRACPELRAEDILTELRVQVPDITGTVLPALINELTTVSPPVVLVLDDYHLIKERSCHDQLTFLLLHLPPAIQIVLLTRVDPPLPLARLRASGEIAEIRQRDLSFTAAETATLVRAVAGVQLSEPDVSVLVERTEGWPAGVYLSALSLRGHGSPHSFVTQFGGGNRFIADFLVDEVVGRQPGEIQRFLTRTSILARMCGPLCDVITGAANGAETLEVLERENLFLVPLDDYRKWYRYHYLFRQLLRRQLARTEPGVAAVLRKRASEWHRLAGSVEEAISYALAADDVPSAVALITRHWAEFADLGRTATLRGWIHALGDDRITANPVVAHCAAMAAALSGDRESVRRWLPVIEKGDYQGPLPDGIKSLQSSAALLRGIYGFEGLAVMRESAAIATSIEDDPASPWYAAARSVLGFSLYLSGEITAAARPAEEAVRSEPSIPLIRLLALSVLSLIQVELGQISRAEELASAARLLADRGDLARTPQSSVAYTAAGAVYASRGMLAEARSDLDHALRSRRKVLGISQWPTLVALLLQARVVWEMGNANEARELAGEARQRLMAQPEGTEVLQARLAELDRRISGRAGMGSVGEPLTDREVAVLRLLAGTLSLSEISRELLVSTNTIKTHTRNIYRKLGVATRRDAVQQAQRLGLH
jgi:LuxR family transcriptional regulator, maltose regulon positive regulatory protein